MAIEITRRDLLRLGWHKPIRHPSSNMKKRSVISIQGMLGQYGFNHESDIRAITVNRIPRGYACAYFGLDDPEWEEGQAPHEVGEPSLGGSPLPIPIQRLVAIWMHLLTPANGQLKNRQILTGD